MSFKFDKESVLAAKNEHSARGNFCAAVHNTSYHEQDERLSMHESNSGSAIFDSFPHIFYYIALCGQR